MYDIDIYRLNAPYGARCFLTDNQDNLGELDSQS